MNAMQKITIFLFALWLFSGFAGVVIGIDEENFSKQELRKPSIVKDFTTYENSEAILADIEKFWDDRIFLRKYYIALYQTLHLENVTAAFKSTGSHVLGLDSWIFLGNSYSNVIAYTKNIDNFSDTDVDKKVLRLQELQEIVKRSNIPYVMMLAPNKHSVYEEYLPTWLKPKSSFRFADAVCEKAQRNGLLVSFSKKALLQEKIIANEQGGRLYSKDDTHWNLYGAFTAFKEAWDILLSQADMPDFVNALTIKEVEKKSNGDLITIGKYPDVYRDTLGYVCTLDEDAKNTFVKKKHLLIIGDSFTGYLMPLFGFAFDKITQIHWNEVKTASFEKLLAELKPDAVVYQVVERHFVHDGIKE